MTETQYQPGHDSGLSAPKCFIRAGYFRGARSVTCLSLLFILATASATLTGADYEQAELAGAIAALQKRSDSGAARLAFDKEHGYLPAVLEQLKVPRSSQVLVFSKTSFHQERISPKTPRALYYSDEVYVSWLPGGTQLEISCVDPQVGAVFYTLPQREVPQPKFLRNNQCLSCHTSSKNLNIPGYLVRSFPTDENGLVDLTRGTALVTHNTPLAERWGGWYVSGDTGKQKHRGNLAGQMAYESRQRDPGYLGNVQDLNQFFDASKYLLPTSDIVALMVLEHQAHMQNLLTRLQHDATAAARRNGTPGELKEQVSELVAYLLFRDEAILEQPIKGASAFDQEFATQGPKDTQGRSLRQFDLQRRLFRYPCSYMIYSPSFDQLPREAKLMVYRELWNVLCREDPSKDYPRLDADTRQAILQILVETKPDLPMYWKL